MDSRHTVAVLRFQGKEAGILKGEISSDGKVLTVENEYAASNLSGLVGKQIQHWEWSSTRADHPASEIPFTWF